MSDFLAADQVDWIVQQESREGFSPSQILQYVEKDVSMVAHRWIAEVTGQSLSDDDERFPIYLRRLWNCLEYHWRHFSETEPIRLSIVISRLESEQSKGLTERPACLLRDVIVAQALQLQDPKAAMLFEEEFMPFVRSVAFRVGGAEAVDLFSNFTADLILAEDGRSSRLASYVGKKPLRSWLQIVVKNCYISRVRQQRELTSELPDLGVIDRGSDQIDTRPCADLLKPIFGQAVDSLEMEDRVILKLLILDGVSNQMLARSIGIHSGNLTRRRQKASEQVFSEIRRLSLATDSPQQTAACIEFLLSGDQPDLKERLAELLTAELRAACSPRPCDLGEVP